MPAGPRNTQYPSASGYEYPSETYTRTGLTPPGLPKPRATPPGVTDLAGSFLLNKLDDLLSPGPKVGDLAQAAINLGVKPIVEAATDEISDIPREFNRGLRKLARVPDQRVDSFLGRKTLGTPTVGEILRAANATVQASQRRANPKMVKRQANRSGVRINKAGELTVPSTRKAVRDLRVAQAQYDRNTGIETGLGPNADRFADALAKYGNYDPSAIGAWVRSEGGAFENGGDAGPQNWLGIGYPGHRTPFATSPYFSGSPERAGRAAGEWIEGKIGSDYDYEAAPSIKQIAATAGGGSAQDFVSALAQSHWGTNVGHVQQNLGAVNVRRDPEAAQALQVAKANARAVGINPTRFNGDVAGGGPDFTWVRADAKGMVDWVRSALGTDEGTARAERWGSRFGLNTVTAPWCANFVSNGLLRRGITELPSNPNYVPSYEQEWAQYAVRGGLAAAKPGDLITYSGEHIAVYVGDGQAIGGNQSDSVTQGEVNSLSSYPISMIIRPPYRGGKVKVADSQIPGSSMGAALGGVGGEVAVGGPAVGGASIAPQRERAMVSAGAVPISELLRPMTLEPIVSGEEDETEGLGELARILKRGAL